MQFRPNSENQQEKIIMSAKTEKLLNLYKSYESLVRDSGADVLETEDQLPELESNQMRLVRQIRNFLSHNKAPGFVEPTDKMLTFLEGQVIGWRMRGDVVRKHLKTPAASVCDATTACADALKKLAKQKTMKLVVADGTGTVHLCGLFEIAAGLSADPQAALLDIPVLKEKPVFVSPDTLMADLDLSRVNICTKTGKADGKILGVVVPQ